MFRCEPYSAVLTAKACMARQERHRQLARPDTYEDMRGYLRSRPAEPKSFNQRFARKRDVLLATCARCEVGTRIAGRVGVVT